MDFQKRKRYLRDEQPYEPVRGQGRALQMADRQII